MTQQVVLDPEARADHHNADEPHHVHAVGPDLAYKRTVFVNVVFYGQPKTHDRGWVLIDTGVPLTADLIAKAAAERFGEGIRPAATILTHGHFDHTSGLVELSEQYDCPIFAHEAERPYLDGTASYPSADAGVGGGLMTLLSPLYPRGPLNVSERLHSLPPDGSVPFMPGWKWLHTPGHSAGHISLWRAADRALIAGDAFITTAPESAYAALAQTVEMHGPPMYLTPDWDNAATSVSRLAALEPEVVITGHGRAMEGPAMREALHTLASTFADVAVPKHGKYVGHPATAANGEAYVKVE